MHPTNKRRCYIVTSSLIGWMHTQNGCYIYISFILQKLKHIIVHTCSSSRNITKVIRNYCKIDIHISIGNTYTMDGQCQCYWSIHSCSTDLINHCYSDASIRWFTVRHSYTRQWQTTWQRGQISTTCNISVLRNYSMDHFVYAPSQWEMMLHCYIASHWLGIYTKWFLL